MDNNQNAILLNYCCLRESETLQRKKRRCTMCPVSYAALIALGFRLSNNRVSERCPVPIDSDKRHSTV
ncbi:hypothetical protein TNCV_1753671 [Trichonephila clavipes]|nr:hypothetical protein TNCV_1753671 [Trichonephila clavipes]